MNRPKNPPVFAGGVVGLDLGLREFATLSTGEKIAPPQYYRKAQKKRLGTACKTICGWLCWRNQEAN